MWIPHRYTSSVIHITLQKNAVHSLLPVNGSPCIGIIPFNSFGSPISTLRTERLLFIVYLYLYTHYPSQRFNRKRGCCSVLVIKKISLQHNVSRFHNSSPPNHPSLKILILKSAICEEHIRIMPSDPIPKFTSETFLSKLIIVFIVHYQHPID